MAIRYVTNVGGLSSGSASTPATAWDAVYAQANYTSGDILYYSVGQYRHPTTGWTFNQSVTVQKDPSQSGVVTFLAAVGAASSTAIITIGNAASRVYTIGSPSSIGEILVDCENLFNDGIVGSTTAGLYTLNLNGVFAINAIIRPIRIRSPDININSKNCTTSKST